MNASFKYLIADSWNGMLKLLFRPLRPGHWIVLVCVAALSGELLSGPGMNFNFPSDWPPGAREEQAAEEGGLTVGEVDTGGGTESVELQDSSPPAPIDLKALRAGFQQFVAGWGLRIALIAFAVLLLVIVFFTWLRARLTFVFLQNIVRGTAEIRGPFRSHKKLGDSYFVWLLLYGLVFWALAAGIVGLAVLKVVGILKWSDIGQVAWDEVWPGFIPLALLLAGLIIAGWLVGVIARDFMVPVMFRRGTGVTAAWLEVLELAGRHLGRITLYLLVKLGLGIAAVLASAVGLLLIVLVVYVPLILYFLAGVLLAVLGPLALKILLTLALLAAALTVWGATSFLIQCCFLPFSIFFRTLSLKFLASLEPDLDCFQEAE
ncbi:MAG: hypothetical protein HYY14_06960 [Candidatus Omnitrophica bacterium]|nr:hypothetical protein [Candidatus Omnitrophota bacterium]